jgi:hypothetical protein
MSLHSLVSIILGTGWTLDSIEKQTNWAVAKLVFLPLFFYRMFAWLIIITFLQIFSVVVLGGMAMVNGLVFLLAHDPDKVEPIVQTFLSLVFPAPKLPSSDLDNQVSMKILFSLVVAGNLYLLGVLGCLHALYYYNFYNPWCSASKITLQVS